MAQTDSILTEAEIDYLLRVPKPVEEDWRTRLLALVETGTDARSKLELGDLESGAPIRGRLHLYARSGLNQEIEGDWSVGFVYTDYADRSFRVLRCNGAHPSDHVNRIEGNVIVRTPHVHRLTERYQRLRRGQPDGFAEPTHAYTDMGGAIEELADRINLEARGRLFL